MGRVQHMTRNTKTSCAAIAKRAEGLVIGNLPDIIRRVIDVERASKLLLTITVKPAGRTEATKDPDITVSCKPDYGAEVVTFKARLTGEGDGAQLSLISELLPEEVGFQDDETDETGEPAEAVAH